MSNQAIEISKDVSIAAIKTTHLEVAPGDEFLNNPQEISEYTYDFDQKSGVDIDKKYARCEQTYTFNALDKGKNRLDFLVKITIVYVFNVENVQNYIVEDDGNEGMHPALGIALASISYSTSRGIIMEKTSNMAIDPIVLPIVDPTLLLLGDTENHPQRS